MKKYVSGLLAVIIAIGATAFTTSGKTHSDALQWYQLAAGADPSVAANYTLSSGMPPGQDPGCPTPPSIAVCAIKANPGTGGHPSATDLSAIKSASSTFTTSVAGSLQYKP